MNSKSNFVETFYLCRRNYNNNVSGRYNMYSSSKDNAIDVMFAYNIVYKMKCVCSELHTVWE